MRRSIRLVLTASFLGFSGPALAYDFPDHGQAPPTDPYVHPRDVKNTTGRIEGFRKLCADADALADSLAPAAPPAAPADPAKPAPTHGDLPVHNPTYTWAEVSVADTRIGTISTLGEGLIKNVKPGTYDVTFKLPSGYSFTRRVATIPRDGN